MKKIITTALLVIIGLAVNAQDFTFPKGTKLSVWADINKKTVSLSLPVENKLDTELQLYWKVTANTLKDVNGWTYQLCDNVNCFATLPPSGKMGLIEALGKTNFIVDVNSNKIAGSGLVSLCVWKDNDEANCQEITCEVKIVPTSIDEPQSNNHLLVYPNPAQETLTIGAPTISIKQLSIVDAMGKETEMNHISNVLNISHLTNGMYWLKIIDIDGNLTTQKFLKN